MRTERAGGRLQGRDGVSALVGRKGIEYQYAMSHPSLSMQRDSAVSVGKNIPNAMHRVASETTSS